MNFGSGLIVYRIRILGSFEFVKNAGVQEILYIIQGVMQGNR